MTDREGTEDTGSGRNSGSPDRNAGSSKVRPLPTQTGTREYGKAKAEGFRESKLGATGEDRDLQSSFELRELERLFTWATQVGRGEICAEDFVYFEGADENPLLVRRSAVTSIQPGVGNSTTHLMVSGSRVTVQGSYEATIAKLLEPEPRPARA